MRSKVLFLVFTIFIDLIKTNNTLYFPDGIISIHDNAKQSTRMSGNRILAIWLSINNSNEFYVGFGKKSADSSGFKIYQNLETKLLTINYCSTSDGQALICNTDESINGVTIQDQNIEGTEWKIYINIDRKLENNIFWLSDKILGFVSGNISNNILINPNIVFYDINSFIEVSSSDSRIVSDQFGKQIGNFSKRFMISFLISFITFFIFI